MADFELPDLPAIASVEEVEALFVCTKEDVRESEPPPLPKDDPIQEVFRRGQSWFADFVTRMNVDFGFFMIGLNKLDLNPPLWDIIARHPQGAVIRGTGTFKELYSVALGIYQEAKSLNGDFSAKTSNAVNGSIRFSEPLKKGGH